MIIPPAEQINPLIKPRQSLLEKIKAHKTAVILSSLGAMILIGMSTYLFSYGKNTLFSPATIENIPTQTPTTPPTPTKKPTSTPTLIPTPTINPQVISWKTYTNSTYKYNIKYPPDWVARDLGTLEPKIPSYIAFNPITASQSSRFITISTTTRTYQEQLALGASSSAVTYAGIKGTKQSFQDSDGNTSTVIILPRTNNLLVLRAKTGYSTTFNLMLTTLKVN